MNKYVIIVAGGSGSRMKSAVPKQFMLLGGKPILMRTMERFVQAIPDINLVLVLADNLNDQWDQLCEQYDFQLSHQLVNGGETRYHSVKNGLEKVPSGSLVGIHDAARPLVSLETICRVYNAAAEFGNASPYVPAVESMRMGDALQNKAIDRSTLMIVQTPQCFHADLLKPAFEKPYRDTFTDDASVLEAHGVGIRLVEGNRENIKITTADDLLIATAFWAAEQQSN